MNVVDGPLIKAEYLPVHILQGESRADTLTGEINLNGGLHGAVKQLEKKVIVEALEQCAWNVSRTAKQLKIPRQTLQYKLKSYGLALKKDQEALP